MKDSPKHEATDGQLVSVADSHSERVARDRTPPPTLDPKVEEAVDRWFGALVETVGPMISTGAYNALSDSRDNLKRQIAAALVP